VFCIQQHNTDGEKVNCFWWRSRRRNLSGGCQWVQVYKLVKALKDYTVKAQSSAGSIENLRKVDRNRSQLGVVYSGRVYLGRNGMLKNDTNRYENLPTVAFL
jgi:TRAP-type uncharacterized transport system, periplasmic component